MGELQEIEQLISDKQEELRPAGERAREIQAERERLEVEVLALQKKPSQVDTLVKKQGKIAKLNQLAAWIRPVTDSAQKEIVELGARRDRILEFIKLENARLTKAQTSLERCQRNQNQAGTREAEKNVAGCQIRLRQLGAIE